MHKTLSLLTLLCALCLLPKTNLYAKGLDELKSQQLFDQANNLFAQGAQLAKKDPDKAKALYEDALLRYQRLINDRKIINGKLFYNLGNLYFMRQEMGYAVLNYRRALQLRPTDPSLLANLKVARQRIKTTIKLDSSEKFLDLLLNWHEDIPRPFRLRLLQLLCMTIGFAGLAFHKFAPRHPNKRLVLVSLISAAVLVTLSLFVEASRHSQPEGVILKDQTVGRKGPSEFAYQPSFDHPLAAGMEFQFKEKRGDWLRIELLDQRETWIPSTASEFIDISNIEKDR